MEVLCNVEKFNKCIQYKYNIKKKTNISFVIEIPDSSKTFIDKKLINGVFTSKNKLGITQNVTAREILKIWGKIEKNINDKNIHIYAILFRNLLKVKSKDGCYDEYQKDMLNRIFIECDNKKNIVDFCALKYMLNPDVDDSHGKKQIKRYFKSKLYFNRKYKSTSSVVIYNVVGIISAALAMLVSATLILAAGYKLTEFDATTFCIAISIYVIKDRVKDIVRKYGVPYIYNKPFGIEHFEKVGDIHNYIYDMGYVDRKNLNKNSLESIIDSSPPFNVVCRKFKSEFKFYPKIHNFFKDDVFEKYLCIVSKINIDVSELERHITDANNTWDIYIKNKVNNTEINEYRIVLRKKT